MPIDSDVVVLLLLLCDDDDAMRSPGQELALEEGARREDDANEKAEKANEAGTPKRLVHAKVAAST